jgi:hypothetical protein
MGLNFSSGPKKKMKVANCRSRRSFASTDQWSPLNQDGKKQYDRDFLLQLQYDPLSKERPANLPTLDIVKNSAVCSAPVISTTKDWLPSFVKPNTSRVSNGFRVAVLAMEAFTRNKFFISCVELVLSKTIHFYCV